MHGSSFENMRRCYQKYVLGGPLETRGETIVLDIGGADVNGSYREIFGAEPFRYIAADLTPGPGVEMVLTDPYSIPLPDASVHLVISGQALEHCEFFWRAFAEMNRVLHPEGFIFLIAPSAGPIHRYPVDCYRFYPDAFGALAKYAGCVLVESWLDPRGPWRDLVGVFRRADAPPIHPVPAATVPASGWDGPSGAPEEEALRGKLSYLEVLDRLHRELTPTHYLEIGVRHGVSLAMARGSATGVDPAPELSGELGRDTAIARMTSDVFFASPLADLSPDLAFIDGMHLFEYALRDFMNIEARAAPGAVLVIDDIFPNHPAQAERQRRTRAWTGDVWRVVEALRKYRPDLFLLPLDAAPTGLLLVAGLDPTNRLLWDIYNPMLREIAALPGPPRSALEREGAIDPSSVEFTRVLDALKAARGAAACPPTELVSRLRRAFAPQTPKLSVVVVAYNMARELPRTIRSLSPAMQRGIDPTEYEIIVIDNGSTCPFDEAEIRNMAPNLTIQRQPNATVSPVPAINYGISLARGDLVGVFIDGARIASPGLLANALAASKLHERPVIGAIAFHLGPTTQMESLRNGYNQKVEDALLASSGWEEDGYRLFSISALAGSSAGGWFEVPAESNSIFLRAEHWKELGGWDENFVTPGGGLVNLDMWARACADPHGQLIMLLGEATFHQVHGGVATNNPNPPQGEFHAEYMRLRGCPYKRPSRKPSYYGTLPGEAFESLKHSISGLERR